jgi:membrane protease YdiL (CAAX protease family)
LCDVGAGALHGLLAFVVLDVGVGSGLQILAGAIGIDVPTMQEGFRTAVQSPQLVPFLALSAGVIAPICEELFFRGLLYQSATRRWSPRWAAVLSSAAWALLHIQSGLGVTVVVSLIISSSRSVCTYAGCCTDAAR